MREMKKRNLRMGLMLGGCAAVMLIAAALVFRGSGGNLGYLVLLLCPVMHLFMHRYHHTGARNGKPEETEPTPLALEHHADVSPRTTGEDTQN